MLDTYPVFDPLLGQAAGVFAQANASAGSVPVHPIRLILLVAYLYLCMYCVQRVQFGTLVAKKHKPWANVITLFTGPLLLLVALIVETSRASRRRQEPFFETLKAQLSNIMDRAHLSGGRRRVDESAVHLMDASGRSIDEIYGHSRGKGKDTHTLELTEVTIASALDRRASDILIDPKDDFTYTIRLRIDGMLKLAKELDAERCRALINSIKAVSGMDIAEHRRAQDGGFVARRGDAMSSFRVASAGVINGEKLSIRVLNKEAGASELTDLGLSRNHLATIQKALLQPSGMILICGPAGSGKTTSMYAMIGAIDRFERNVITVEDPIEAVLGETSQIEVNPKADITFASTLRSVLRQDPDVICVGEIRDEETAEIALRAAQTGHLVLATMHCEGNATAIVRLLDLGVSPLLLASGLSLVMSQRLVRCLCSQCKEPAELSDTQIARLTMKKVDLSNICQPGHCKRCEQTGFYGRTAVCDLMVADEKLKTDIARNKSFWSYLRTDGVQKGRSNLRKQGLKKVIAGQTSLQEIKRVIG